MFNSLYAFLSTMKQLHVRVLKSIVITRYIMLLRDNGLGQSLMHFDEYIPVDSLCSSNIIEIICMVLIEILSVLLVQLRTNMDH